MTDKKLICHLNMTQVAGKFAFVKPDEGIQNCINLGFRFHVSVCELSELITSNYYSL